MTGEAVPHELAPGATLPERSVHSRNLFRDATNRIHDDAGARQHGYAGALVAGGARPIARIRHTAIYQMLAHAGLGGRERGTP